MQAVSRAVAAAWGRDREALGADQKLASAGPPSRTAQ
jgi:hypothetical protein